MSLDVIMSPSPKEPCNARVLRHGVLVARLIPVYLARVGQYDHWRFYAHPEYDRTRLYEDDELHIDELPAWTCVELIVDYANRVLRPPAWETNVPAPWQRYR
jgi:hypothetical protein